LLKIARIKRNQKERENNGEYKKKEFTEDFSSAFASIVS
jgi:hypothetical protein